MASNRVWNLMYVRGNTGRVVGDGANPQDRTGALAGAATIAGNGWQVWVEHEKTGKRIFESANEVAHRKHEEAKRGSPPEGDNMPGFRTRAPNDLIAEQPTKRSMHRRQP